MPESLLAAESLRRAWRRKAGEPEAPRGSMATPEPLGRERREGREMAVTGKPLPASVLVASASIILRRPPAALTARSALRGRFRSLLASSADVEELADKPEDTARGTHGAVRPPDLRPAWACPCRPTRA